MGVPESVLSNLFRNTHFPRDGLKDLGWHQHTVAVEKLILGELIEISSRQDARQAICRKQLTIYHPPKSSPFCKYGVFQHPRLLSPAESESVNRCGVCSAFRAIGSARHHPLTRFGRQRLSCYVGFAYLRILRLSIQTNIDGFQQQRQSPRLRPKPRV